MNEIALGRFTVGEMQISADQTVTSSKWKMSRALSPFLGKSIMRPSIVSATSMNPLWMMQSRPPMKGEKQQPEL